MVSFRCYDNSDVIVTLIIINFYLYLIQLRKLCSKLLCIDPERPHRANLKLPVMRIRYRQ